jgi:hypothetical protein
MEMFVPLPPALSAEVMPGLPEENSIPFAPVVAPTASVAESDPTPVAMAVEMFKSPPIFVKIRSPATFVQRDPARPLTPGRGTGFAASGRRPKPRGSMTPSTCKSPVT